ncbi:MAG: tetratricopeptide repeat protein [Mariniphaga sp.]|jgi:tetratricopeptide (TPR) repeat protein|nr:tetratricopeptide repeat protein [Mariniphaga sp.]
MISKKKQTGFTGSYLLSLVVIAITLNFCTNHTEKDIEQENKRQRLFKLMDSINNNNVYQIPKKVLSNTAEALSLADELNDSVTYCQIMIIKAGCFHELGNPDSTFIIAQQALNVAVKIDNDTLLAKANNMIGHFYSEINDYINATSFYTEALRLMEKAGNNVGIALIKNSLGIIYREIGEIEKSIECYTEALPVFDSIHDEFKTALICLNLVAAYSVIKDSTNMRKYYKRSFSILEKFGDTLQMTKLLSNQSLFYIDIGKIDSAIITLNLVMDYSKAMNNKRMFCVALYNLGSLYYTHMNDFGKARLFIEKCLNMNEEVSDLEINMEAQHVLSEIENSVGNYKRSNDLFRKYIVLRDSIKGGNIKKEIMAIELQNNLQKHVYEAMLLKQKIELKGKQNTILVISFVVFLLLVIMTIFAVRISYKNLEKSKALKELETQRLEEQMEIDRKINEIEKLKLDAELDSKSKELVSFSLKLVTKNDLLNKISRLSNKYYDNKVLDRNYFNALTKIVKENLNIDKEWNQFKILFEKLHHGFFDRMKKKCPSLTEYELRFCAYVKINLSPKEISRILGVSPNTVKSFRYRLKKQLDLKADESIEDFVRNI